MENDGRGEKQEEISQGAGRRHVHSAERRTMTQGANDWTIHPC